MAIELPCPGGCPGPYERLYDELADPEETTDLSQDPAHASVKAALLEQMFERMTTTAPGARADPAGTDPARGDPLVLWFRDRREPPERVKGFIGPPAPQTQKDRP